MVGALMAAGPVVIMAASFGNAAYERLPLDEQEEGMMQPQVQEQDMMGTETSISQSGLRSTIPSGSESMYHGMMGNVGMPAGGEGYPWPAGGGRPSF